MTVNRRRVLQLGGAAVGAVAAGAWRPAVSAIREPSTAAPALGQVNSSEQAQDRAPTPTPTPTPTQAQAQAQAHGTARGSVPFRILTLENVHTAESVTVEYHRDGTYLADSLAAVEELLRDVRTAERHWIDPALLDYLHDAAVCLGADPVFSVLSGYRSPHTHAQLRARSSGVAQRSLHLEGRAIDVRLVGANCADLAAQALGMARGGVGFYRKADFVHLDTGACRHWMG